MALRLFLFVVFLILAIKCVESKQTLRWFIVKQDKPPKPKPLTDFSVYDSEEKNRLYLIRTLSTDIDTITLVDYRARKIMGNVEGEWTNGIFNVSLSIYDNKSDKWIDGTVTFVNKLFSNQFIIRWNGEKLTAKSNSFTKTIKIYSEKLKTSIAQFRYRSIWRSGLKYKYDLKIFTPTLPDALFLLPLTVIHHAEQVSQTNN